MQLAAECMHLAKWKVLLVFTGVVDKRCVHWARADAQRNLANATFEALFVHWKVIKIHTNWSKWFDQCFSDQKIVIYFKILNFFKYFYQLVCPSAPFHQTLPKWFCTPNIPSSSGRPETFLWSKIRTLKLKVIYVKSHQQNCPKYCKNDFWGFWCPWKKFLKL